MLWFLKRVRVLCTFALYEVGLFHFLAPPSRAEKGSKILNLGEPLQVSVVDHTRLDEQNILLSRKNFLSMILKLNPMLPSG